MGREARAKTTTARSEEHALVFVFDGSEQAQTRFNFLYVGFLGGALLAAQRQQRTLNDVRSEAKILAAFEEASAENPAETNTLTGDATRTLNGAHTVRLSDDEHELLRRYLELAIPKMKPKEAPAAIDALDFLMAAETR